MTFFSCSYIVMHESTRCPPRGTIRANEHQSIAIVNTISAIPRPRQWYVQHGEHINLQAGQQRLLVSYSDRLVGLVVRRSPRERKIPGSNPACDGIFSGSSHTSDLKIGTPVATLPGAWRYRVSTGTGRPGVSIL